MVNYKKKIKEIEQEVEEKLDSFNLSENKQEGGHVIYCHIGHSSQDLRDACLVSRKSATSFENIEEAESFISTAIYMNSGAVAEWLYYRDSGNLSLEVNFEEETGIGYFFGKQHNWKDGPIKCDSVVVVLRRIRQTHGNDTFYVLTSYTTSSKIKKTY